MPFIVPVPPERNVDKPEQTSVMTEGATPSRQRAASTMSAKRKAREMETELQDQSMEDVDSDHQDLHENRELQDHHQDGRSRGQRRDHQNGAPVSAGNRYEDRDEILENPSHPDPRQGTPQQKNRTVQRGTGGGRETAAVPRSGKPKQQIPEQSTTTNPKPSKNPRIQGESTLPAPISRNYRACFWDDDEHSNSKESVTFCSNDPNMMSETTGTVAYEPSETDGPVNAEVVMALSTNGKWGARLEVSGIPVGWLDDPRDVIRGLMASGHTVSVSLVWNMVIRNRCGIIAIGSARWKAGMCVGSPSG